MKKHNWAKQHKWLGLILAFFIIMFAVSGLVLNHPLLFSHVDISRQWLPSDYQYNHWNKGLMRSTIAWHNKVIIYGDNGLWLTDSTAKKVSDLNRGLPTGADNRQIRRVVQTHKGDVFALSTYELYQLHTDTHTWHRIEIKRCSDKRLSDIDCVGDSLIITSRSMVYMSTPPYRTFKLITLPAANNYQHEVSLFRTVWLLHSGELFGTIGKIVVDLIALTLILLSVSGIACWFLPKLHIKLLRHLTRYNFLFHNKIGKVTIILTLFICITGWFLRPPALIAIAKAKIHPIPFSTMDSNNAWHDKLRTLRYDDEVGDWLLYSSDGFYRLSSLQAVPQAEAVQPDVSVMGINAQTKDAQGRWLIGSFSGMFVWDRQHHSLIDYYTHRPPTTSKGIPFSNHAVAGYTANFGSTPLVVDYQQGIPTLPMPSSMRILPMSLRHLCIEIHTGRIYTFIGKANILFIFFMGLLIMWCIWSGKMLKM